jgi:hypothetical protein
MHEKFRFGREARAENLRTGDVLFHRRLRSQRAQRTVISPWVPQELSGVENLRLLYAPIAGEIR